MESHKVSRSFVILEYASNTKKRGHSSPNRVNTHIKKSQLMVSNAFKKSANKR